MAASVAVPTSSGFVQDKFDPRDHYYVPEASTQPPDHINLREDHAQLVSEIYDQGTTQSCTANAIAAAFWYEEKAGRRALTWGPSGPSRLFIYWLARGGYKEDDHSIRRPVDTGSPAREGIRGVATIGACAEEDWPFDISYINWPPPDTAFDKATPHKIISFYRLDPDRPDADDHKLTVEQKDKIGASLLENLRKCLAEQYPVVFGFWYYLPHEEMFDQTQAPWVLKDVWNLPDKKFPRHTFPGDLPPELRLRDKHQNPISPGHNVLAIGYDDMKQQVLVQNSWGPKWGDDKGIFWMPYSWITDFAASNDFWTIRTSPIATGIEPKRWETVHEEIMKQ